MSTWFQAVLNKKQTQNQGSMPIEEYVLKLHISPGNQKTQSELVQPFSTSVYISLILTVEKVPSGNWRQITRLSKLFASEQQRDWGYKLCFSQRGKDKTFYNVKKTKTKNSHLLTVTSMSFRFRNNSTILTNVVQVRSNFVLVLSPPITLSYYHYFIILTSSSLFDTHEILPTSYSQTVFI